MAVLRAFCCKEYVGLNGSINHSSKETSLTWSN